MAAGDGPGGSQSHRDGLPVLLTDPRRLRHRRRQVVLPQDRPVRPGHEDLGRREHRARLPHVDVRRPRRHRDLFARRARLQELPVQVRRRPRVDRAEEPHPGSGDVDGRRPEVLLRVDSNVRVQAGRTDGGGEQVGTSIGAMGACGCDPYLWKGT